jgi:uncharacterized protein (DUF697 family)
VVAQTNLHEGYATGSGHVVPYPFGSAGAASPSLQSLARALDHQRALFAGLPGRGALIFVPIDFTQPGDGFEPVDYGREALVEALLAAAPAAAAVALGEFPGARGDGPVAKFDAHILGFAFAAGAGDVFPVAGIVAVPVVQAAMLRQLGKLFGVHWDKRAYAEFAAALGAGTLVRTASSFGIRQLVKLIPVYGQTAGAAAAAAASFATTYAMGKAAAHFLMRRRQGRQTEELASVYREALGQAFGIARARDIGADLKGAGR